MNKKKRVLFLNTTMLYILTFSGYLLSFITAPYQTRVLGPEVYGIIGLATAYTSYVQLFVDFGFLLSSTEDVAKSRGDTPVLSRIMTSVLFCKLGLGVIAFLAFSALCFLVESMRENLLIFQLFFVATFLNALLPDFLYRGMECMTTVTIRTLIIRLFFTASIFLFLHSKEQAYVIPILNGLGALGACIASYIDLKHRFGIRFVRVTTAEIWQTLRRSFGYFVSRIASTVYSATNTVILGLIYPPASVVIGHYSSAERLMSTARSAMSPISDSLYPYMVKNKDFKLVKKFLLILMPPILIGCAGVAIFAEPLCAWLFGEEFREAGRYLRLLMPVVAVTLPTYIMGFPVLSPLGLAKYANRSVVVGAIVHATLLLILFLCGLLSVETICISTCITECVVLIIRIGVVLLRHKLRTPEDTETVKES